MKTLHSDEIEKNILGSIFLNEDNIDKIISSIPNSDYFFNTQNKMIYNCILKLYKENKKIDPLIVIEEVINLKDYNLYFNIQNIQAYICEVLDKTVSSVLLDEHIQILINYYLQRQILNICSATKNNILINKEPTDNIINNMLINIYNLINKNYKYDNYKIDKKIEYLISKIEKIMKNEILNDVVKTNFIHLDNLINGFNNSDLIIIASRPGIGKTSFALSLILNILSNKIPIAFFTIEMSEEQILIRLLSQLSKINNIKIMTGELSNEEFKNLFFISDYLYQLPLFIIDKPKINTIEMSSIAKQLKKQNDIKLIVIDYLQLIEPIKRYKNRYLEISDITKELKQLAKELNIPIILLAQLNRNVELRKPPIPILSDLRESGSIEQDADLIMMLYRDEYYYKENSTEPNIAKVIVSKHRHGATGTIKLLFNKNCMSFSNLYEDIPDNPFNS